MLDVRAEVLRLVEKHLQGVRPSGSENVMALCPYHDDKTASFAMNTLNGVYFCHACHAKGNLYTFLRDMGTPRILLEENYKELLEEARKAIPGIPKSSDPGVYTLEPIPEEVLGYFDGYTIPSLLEKGFQEETLRRFDVGYDKWHQRITYPIRDIKGCLVGINGRTIHPGLKPRYKIYDREYAQWGLPVRTEPWERRKVLYNAHNVLTALDVHRPRDSYIVVVEGYKACMWVWQSGIRNVVAVMGSYFSWEHRWIVEKFTGRIFLFLDNNDAGIGGTEAAGGQIRDCKSSIDPFVMEYPERLANDEDAQPDSLTPGELWNQFSDAIPFESWLMKRRGYVPNKQPIGNTEK